MFRIFDLLFGFMYLHWPSTRHVRASKGRILLVQKGSVAATKKVYTDSRGRVTEEIITIGKKYHK